MHLPDSLGAPGARLSPAQALLGLTLLIIIVVALVAPDLAAALALAALVLVFYVLWLRGAPPGRGEGAGAAREPYATGAPTYERNPAIGLGYASSRPSGGRTAYPGAIRIDPGHAVSAAEHGAPDSYLWWGNVDALEADTAGLPYGNPYNTGRLAFPAAAGPCVDDMADDSELDGDEQITYQVRARNDPTRVTAGSIDRKNWFSQYVDEELGQAEARVWWGEHEL